MAAEIIAGPIFILAMFFGALVIGLKASGPVEQARLRQLEFTADASHELRTPLSVIEAEVDLALGTGRGASKQRDIVSYPIPSKGSDTRASASGTSSMTCCGWRVLTLSLLHLVTRPLTLPRSPRDVRTGSRASPTRGT